MGDGAFSNVYKAIERKTGRLCAVKVVRKYELNSSQVRFVSHFFSESSSFLCIFSASVPLVTRALATHGNLAVGFIYLSLRTISL